MDWVRKLSVKFSPSKTSLSMALFSRRVPRAQPHLRCLSVLNHNYTGSRLRHRGVFCGQRPIHSSGPLLTAVLSKDYYDILNVARNAAQPELKKAFYELAKKHHPDLYQGPEAEKKFQEINKAYEVLKDDQERATYDQMGHDAYVQSKETGGSGSYEGSGFSNFSNPLVEKDAEILASQGHLSATMKILELLGENLSLELVILRHRIAVSSQPGEEAEKAITYESSHLALSSAYGADHGGYDQSNYQFAQGDEWTLLCDALEYKPLAAGNTLAANLYHIFVVDIDKTVEIWSHCLSAEPEKRPYVDHLQDLMEKTIVFALASREMRFSSFLCKLVEKYAKFLASQGQLSTALVILKFMGENIHPEDHIAVSLLPAHLPQHVTYARNYAAPRSLLALQHLVFVPSLSQFSQVMFVHFNVYARSQTFGNFKTIVNVDGSWREGSPAYMGTAALFRSRQGTLLNLFLVGFDDCQAQFGLLDLSTYSEARALSNAIDQLQKNGFSEPVLIISDCQSVVSVVKKILGNRPFHTYEPFMSLYSHIRTALATFPNTTTIRWVKRGDNVPCDHLANAARCSVDPLESQKYYDFMNDFYKSLLTAHEHYLFRK